MLFRSEIKGSLFGIEFKFYISVYLKTSETLLNQFAILGSVGFRDLGSKSRNLFGVDNLRN